MNMKDPEALNIQSLMLGNRKDEIHHRNIRDSLKREIHLSQQSGQDPAALVRWYWRQLSGILRLLHPDWIFAWRRKRILVFTRPMSKVDLESKIKSLMKWIDNLSFLKSFNSLFGSGFTFTKADILVQFSCNVELKNLISKMFQGRAAMRTR